MSYSTNAPAGFWEWPDVQILTAGERRIPAHSKVLVSYERHLRFFPRSRCLDLSRSKHVLFCSVPCAEGVGVAGVGEYVGSATPTRGRRKSDFHSRSSLRCSRCLRSLALLFQVSILWIPQLGSRLPSYVLVEETVVVGVSA